MPVCGIRIGTVCVNARRHDRTIDGASVRNARPDTRDTHVSWQEDVSLREEQICQIAIAAMDVIYRPRSLLSLRTLRNRLYARKIERHLLDIVQVNFLLSISGIDYFNRSVKFLWHSAAR